VVRVRGHEDRRALVLHRQPDRPDRVVHLYRGHAQSLDLRGGEGLKRDVAQSGPAPSRPIDGVEGRPDDPVEDVPPQRVDGLADGVHLDRSLEEREDLGDEDRQRGDVVDVGVGDDDRADPSLGLQVQADAEAAGVDRQGPVDQERGQGLLAGRIGAAAR